LSILNDLGLMAVAVNSAPRKSVESAEKDMADRFRAAAMALRDNEPETAFKSGIVKLHPTGTYSLKIGYGSDNRWFDHGLHRQRERLALSGNAERDPTAIAAALDRVATKAEEGAFRSALEKQLAAFSTRFRRKQSSPLSKAA